jgi:hypothetical protein
MKSSPSSSAGAAAARYLSGKAHIARFQDLHAFGGHFFRPPVQVIKPGLNQLAVDALARRVTEKQGWLKAYTECETR